MESQSWLGPLGAAVIQIFNNSSTNRSSFLNSKLWCFQSLQLHDVYPSLVSADTCLCGKINMNSLPPSRDPWPISRTTPEQELFCDWEPPGYYVEAEVLKYHERSCLCVSGYTLTTTAGHLSQFEGFSVRLPTREIRIVWICIQPKGKFWAFWHSALAIILFKENSHEKLL